MKKEHFLSWFVKMFLPTVKHLLSEAKVVLVIDGHHYHLNIELIDTARKNGILLISLPPHTTHLLQPLDGCLIVYGPIKTAWKGILKEYKISTRPSIVTKEVFPSLLTKLWKEP